MFEMTCISMAINGDYSDPSDAVFESKIQLMKRETITNENLRMNQGDVLWYDVSTGCGCNTLP